MWQSQDKAVHEDIRRFWNELLPTQNHVDVLNIVKVRMQATDM